MLKPQQIPELKDDRTLFNLAKILIDAINNFGLAMGIDPKPASQVEVADALPAPRAPATVTVSVVSSIVFVILEASPEATDSVFYFVERSDTERFQQVTRFALGHGLQLSVPVLAGAIYWRAFARYQMSGPSPFVVA